MEIRRSDLEILSKLQRMFLSTLLGVKNCPAALMLWDLGVLNMPLRVLKEKLLLYHHISTLPETSLANQIMKTQERLCLPSLRKEILWFLAKYGIHDVKLYSKDKWKIFVKNSIRELNRNQLLESIKSYKKLDYLELALEDFERKHSMLLRKKWWQV